MSELLGSMPPITRMPGETDEEFEARKREESIKALREQKGFVSEDPKLGPFDLSPGLQKKLDSVINPIKDFVSPTGTDTSGTNFSPFELHPETRKKIEDFKLYADELLKKLISSDSPVDTSSEFNRGEVNIPTNRRATADPDATRVEAMQNGQGVAPQADDELLQRMIEPEFVGPRQGSVALDEKTPDMQMPKFIPAEELAKMTQAERIQYRQDRLRAAGAGGDLKDTITGQTDDQLTARILEQGSQPGIAQQVAEETPTDDQFTFLSSEELAKMTPEERKIYNNKALDAWGKSPKSYFDLKYGQTDPIPKRLTEDSYRDDPNVSIPASVRNSMDQIPPTKMTERISQDRKLRQQNTNNEITDPVDETTSLVDAKPDRRPKLSMWETDDVKFADGQPQLRPQPAEINLPPREEPEVSPTALGLDSEYEGIFADTEPSVSAPTPSAKPTVSVEEESAPESTSMLARIGKAIKDNPEMALAGTKSIGSLLAAIGQGRGQRKEDRRVREATGRANLISALTGGKTRPQVQSETPDIGLLGRIGQGLSVAGETGLEALKQKGIQDVKETDAERKQADLERKIKADARRLARDAFKNKYTVAQMENLKNRMALQYDQFGQTILMDEFERDYKERQLEFNREKEKFDKEIENRRAELEKRRIDLAERLGEDRLLTTGQGREIAALQIEHAHERLTMEAEKHAKELTEYDNDEYLRFQERTDKFVKDNKHFFSPERGLASVYGGLKAAMQTWSTNPSSASANAVFNMYQQMFDPATVREGDLQMQAFAQGIRNQIQAWIQRGLGTGFVLSSDVIKNMEQVADEYYDKSLETMNAQLSDFLEINRSQNLPTRELTNIENYFSRRLARPTRTTSNTTGSKDKKDNQSAEEFGKNYGK
jgi:uncharacterized protein YuzE